MFYPDCQFTKVRWFLTIVGLGLYLVDVGTDISLAVGYFLVEQYAWSGLTVLFILVGLLVTQLFSYAWYLDDLRDVLINPEGKETVENKTKVELVVLHVCGFGVLTRYENKQRMLTDRTLTFPNRFGQIQLDVYTISQNISF